MKNNLHKKGFVLASVFDKRGIIDFVKQLKALGYEIVSTEGTGKELTKSRISFIPAQKVSKNPNKLMDCVKTISFRIEASILFDRLSLSHTEEAKELDIKPIDMVICNFPCLKRTIRTLKDFNIRNIDVGGPLMVRAAATNFRHVLVIVDPDDYKKVINAICKKQVTEKFRLQLAMKAFAYTSSYDHEIIQYLKKNETFF